MPTLRIKTTQIEKLLSIPDYPVAKAYGILNNSEWRVVRTVLGEYYTDSSTEINTEVNDKNIFNFSWYDVNDNIYLLLINMNPTNTVLNVIGLGATGTVITSMCLRFGELCFHLPNENIDLSKNIILTPGMLVFLKVPSINLPLAKIMHA